MKTTTNKYLSEVNATFDTDFQIVQVAHSDGKTIQRRPWGGTTADWMDDEKPEWDADNFDYRIKPIKTSPDEAVVLRNLLSRVVETGGPMEKGILHAGFPPLMAEWKCLQEEIKTAIQQ